MSYSFVSSSRITDARIRTGEWEINRRTSREGEEDNIPGGR
jgi:hypothetical protein